MTKITVSLPEDQYTSMIISRSVLLTTRNISDESYRENLNTRFMFNNIFFFFKNRAAYDTMWKHNVEPGLPQKTIRRMRIPCWITKATDIDSEYGILIVFPQQQ